MFKCQLMVSYLCEAHQRNQNNNFVNIPYQTLTALLGNNYRTVLDILKVVDVVAINDHFRFGNGKAYSKSYAIKYQYWSKLTVHEVSDKFIKGKKVISSTFFGSLEFPNSKGGVWVEDADQNPVNSSNTDTVWCSPNIHTPPQPIHHPGQSVQDIDRYADLIRYMHTTISGLKIVDKVKIKHSRHCGRLSHIVNRIKSQYRYNIKDQYGRDIDLSFVQC